MAIKYVHISEDRLLDFLALREKNEDIKPCDIYVDKVADIIYFVETPQKPPRGLRRDCNIYEDYLGDISLDDSCKAINTMGLS